MESKKRIREKSLLLGLTGGIASGKTTVSKILKQLGAKLIDFDLLARRVVEPGKPALKKIKNSFGSRVLLKDGSLNRKFISQIVFKNPEERKKLESLTHPEIYKEFEKEVRQIEKNNPDSVIIQVDVPLLIEFNLKSRFDKILLVYVSPDIQIKRLIARDYITERQAARIIGSQLPIKEKIKHADFVINNEKGIENTYKQVKKVWGKLLSILSNDL